MCHRAIMAGYATGAICGYGVGAELGSLAGGLVAWVGGAGFALLFAYLTFLRGRAESSDAAGWLEHDHDRPSIHELQTHTAT